MCLNTISTCRQIVPKLERTTHNILFKYKSPSSSQCNFYHIVFMQCFIASFHKLLCSCLAERCSPTLQNIKPRKSAHICISINSIIIPHAFGLIIVEVYILSFVSSSLNGDNQYLTLSDQNLFKKKKKKLKT